MNLSVLYSIGQDCKKFFKLKYMTEKKYSIGIIGAGMIAEKHIDSFHKTGRTDIKWVARKDVSKLEAFSRKYSIPKATGDYHDMLQDPFLDAVVITSPPDRHYEMFMDCIKAGKHILLEKPAAFTKSQLENMQAEETKHPEIIIMDCSCRHSRLQPKFNAVKEIIDSGNLGEIYMIHHNCLWRQARAGIEYHPTAKWFLNKSISGGGPLLDWGVYDLSFHLGILSDKPELKKILSATTKRGLDMVNPQTEVFDVEEHFIMMMEFSSGLNYYWERGVNGHVEIPNETRIYGTKGGLKFGFCSWDDPVVYFYDVDDNGKERHACNTSLWI